MNLKINYQTRKGTKDTITLEAFINYGAKEYDMLKQAYVYKPLRYLTGLKINASQWDSIKKQPRTNEDLAKFKLIEKTIQDTYQYLKMKSTDIKPEEFKKELDKRIKGKDDEKVVSKVRIVDHILNVILKSDAYKPKTKENYKSFSNTLENFEKHIGRKLYSNDFNQELFKELITFVRSNKKVNKINAVWTIQKQLRATLNDISREYSLKVLDVGKDIAPKDKIQSVQVDAVYLTFQQIKQIIDYKPTDKVLKEVKLILLILIFSGCRESDVQKIIPQYTCTIGGESFRYARFLTGKTDTEIVVPFLKPLEDAIKENGGKLPSKIDRSVFNAKVKIIAKECKLTQLETLVYVDENNKRQFTTAPFNELVSSHIGRRSFVTNLINFIPVTILAKITGHTLTDSSVIFNYNKISLIDNAVRFVKMLRLSAVQYPDEFPIKLI